MKEIKSKNNITIKFLKKQKLKNRFLLFLDNPKTIQEAFDFNLRCDVILIDEEKLNKVNFKHNQNLDIIITNSDIIKEFSTTKTPQGVVAVFNFEKAELKKPKGNFLVLDGLQDAGNIGSLLRSALGANFKDVFLIESTALTNDKIIRSSMSAIFRLNTYELSRQEFVAFAKENKLNLVGADMLGEDIYKASGLSGVGVVLGNEGNGLSEDVKSLLTKTISIPMENGLESLNVAASGAIIMFEIKSRGK